MSNTVKTETFTLGCLFAILVAVLSYALNGSIGWAIFHFFVWPVYLVYALIARSHEILPSLARMFA